MSDPVSINKEVKKKKKRSSSSNFKARVRAAKLHLFGLGSESGSGSTQSTSEPELVVTTSSPVKFLSKLVTEPNDEDPEFFRVCVWAANHGLKIENSCLIPKRQRSYFFQDGEEEGVKKVSKRRKSKKDDKSQGKEGQIVEDIKKHDQIIEEAKGQDQVMDEVTGYDQVLDEVKSQGQIMNDVQVMVPDQAMDSGHDKIIEPINGHNQILDNFKGQEQTIFEEEEIMDDVKPHEQIMEDAKEQITENGSKKDPKDDSTLDEDEHDSELRKPSFLFLTNPCIQTLMSTKSSRVSDGGDGIHGQTHPDVPLGLKPNGMDKETELGAGPQLNSTPILSMESPGPTEEIEIKVEQQDLNGSLDLVNKCAENSPTLSPEVKQHYPHLQAQRPKAKLVSPKKVQKQEEIKIKMDKTAKEPPRLSPHLDRQVCFKKDKTAKEPPRLSPQLNREVYFKKDKTAKEPPRLSPQLNREVYFKKLNEHLQVISSEMKQTVPNMKKLQEAMESTIEDRTYLVFTRRGLIKNILSLYPCLVLEDLQKYEFTRITSKHIESLESKLVQDFERLLNADWDDPSRPFCLKCAKGWRALRATNYPVGSAEYNVLRNNVGMMFICNQYIGGRKGITSLCTVFSDSKDIDRELENLVVTPHLVLFSGPLSSPTADLRVYAEKNLIFRSATGFYQSVLVMYMSYYIFDITYQAGQEKLFEYFDNLLGIK